MKFVRKACHVCMNAQTDSTYLDKCVTFICIGDKVKNKISLKKKKDDLYQIYLTSTSWSSVIG